MGRGLPQPGSPPQPSTPSGRHREQLQFAKRRSLRRGRCTLDPGSGHFPPVVAPSPAGLAARPAAPPPPRGFQARSPARRDNPRRRELRKGAGGRAAACQRVKDGAGGERAPRGAGWSWGAALAGGRPDLPAQPPEACPGPGRKGPPAARAAEALEHGGPGRVRQRVPPERDLLPAHLLGGVREAGSDLHGARAAPPLPQPRPQPGAGREGGAQGQAGRAKVSSAVQGELNCCNSMGAPEMQQRLEQLKRRIHRVHLYAQDARKKRRKPKSRKPEPILSWDRSRSPGLPPTPLPPPPPATTVASMGAPSPAVYTMPRVFGPFPPLPSTSLGRRPWRSPELRVSCPTLSCSRVVDLTPLVLNPGGFHFSYLAGSNTHKLRCPGFPWTSACGGSASPEEVPALSVKASIFTPPVLLKFQPVPRPKDDSENDPGNAESVPHQRDP
ncbi:basic proline-rich protein-like [Hippopotamus amphibius kiboko]|uniref:basic proline-rich protein-like n=1 Tax=Hippopotamus amphibius kiboko TaxID=575201 RepID=UPI0025922E5D|nr:basic proline-rich protein-like [Hippopotamus amphibius kiboko]